MPVIVKNSRWENFCQNIVSGMTNEAAYARAGFKGNPKTARNHASTLRKKPVIQERISELAVEAAQSACITAERTLREMSYMAYYDATDILEFGTDGKSLIVKDPKTLPVELRRSIVEITQIKSDDGVHYRIKMADKQKALEMLGKHLQLFKDIVRVENVFEVVRDMDDDTLARRLEELERTISEEENANPQAGGGSTAVH